MAKAWFDYLPEPEYRRVFDTKRFRDATEPSDEEKQSWTQKAIQKFREATQAAEDKRMSQALEARQREEAKVPAVQPLGIEARAIPAPRAPMTADIQKFREATEEKRAATGRGIVSGIGAVTERVGSKVQAAREAMLNPEVPVIPSKHPGATEKFATEFRKRLELTKGYLIKYVQAGRMTEEEAQASWETAPQKTLDDMAPSTDKGRRFQGLSLSDIGLGTFMGRKITMNDIYEAEKGLLRWTQTPLLPEEFYTPIERVPVVGEKAAEVTRSLTTPIGVAGTALMPEVTALMTAGELAGWGLGTPIEAGLEKAGLPTEVETPIGTWGPRGILQLGGAFAAPWAGPKIAAKVAKVAASPEMAANIGNFRQGIAKAFAEGEAGGGRLGGKGPRVPAGVPLTPAEELSQLVWQENTRGARLSVRAAKDIPEERLLTGTDALGRRTRVQGTPEFLRDEVKQLQADALKAGERPIETAGPMFAKPEPVSSDIASFRAATEITPGMSKAERLAQWKAGYKPEAAAPGAPTGGVPPTEPPTAPQPPTGGQMPERGYTGAQEIIDTKEATLLRPGKATQVPLVRQGLSVLNPSVTQERTVLVAYNARRAASVSLETAWNAKRAPLIDELTAAWKESPAKYIGPPDRSDVLKGTLADFGQNPGDYTGITPRVKQAVEAYRGHQDAILAEARGKYGVDIQPYPVQPGGFFVPNVATKESLETAADTLSSNYTSSSLASKFGTAKTRLYESAAKRMAHDPTFVPETNIGTLADLHDAALARMAGNETFKLGAGGKMRLEVMQETHPKLANQMLGLRQRLQSLRGTAGRLDQKLDDTVRSFLENPDEMPLSDLADSLDVRITRGPNVGKSAAEINAEIQAVRQEIRQIRPAWENASIDPYVMNRKTFRYYTREQSAAIDKILTTKLPIGQGIVDMIDEIRVTTFGGDISPLTIQGLLGATADPVTLAFNARGIGRTLASGRTLEKLARAEPELVRRYTIATGRPLGQLGAEFRQVAKGPERIPLGVGKAWAFVNDRTMGAVEYLRYQAWKNDSNLLQKLGGKTQVVADAEAANTWSKIMPALAPEERGASALQAQLERTPIISSSFAAGPPALIKDAVSGLAKLGGSRELSPIARWQGLAGREQLAVLRLTTMAGTLATLATLSYIAAGDSPEEAAKKVLNPATGRFLTIATGKQGYVPVGGPFRSLIRGLAPRYVDGKLVPFAGTLQFLRGKEVPPLATTIDLVRGKDFMGRQIVQGDFPQNLLSGLWYAAERHIPLTGGAVSEKIRTGEAKLTDIGTLAREAGTQLLGVNFYETSPYGKLTELWTKYRSQVPVEYGSAPSDFAKADDLQRRWFYNLPEVSGTRQAQVELAQQREQPWGKFTQQRDTAETEFQTRMATYTGTGPEFVAQYDEFKSEWGIRANQFYGEMGERDTRSANEKAADEWWAVELGYTSAGERDWDTFFSERKVIEDANPGLKQWLRNRELERWTEPQLREWVSQMFQAEDIADEYYSIPAKIGMSAEDQESVRAIMGTIQATASDQDVPFEIALARSGIAPELKSRVRRYKGLPANPARERFWLKNRDKEHLFKQFYSELPLEVPAEELVGVGQ